MTAHTARIVRCPTCNTPTKWAEGNPYRPFCSERCRLIDFGAWADEQHRIPGRPELDDTSTNDLDGA